MKENLLSEGAAVDVYIYFGGGDALVAEHLLNGAQVRPALEQMGGKGVAQCVGTDGFLYAGFCGETFYHDEYHGAGEACSSAVEEHIVLFALFDLHEVAVDKPKSYFLDGFLGYGDEPFL